MRQSVHEMNDIATLRPSEQAHPILQYSRSVHGASGDIAAAYLKLIDTLKRNQCDKIPTREALDVAQALYYLFGNQEGCGQLLDTLFAGEDVAECQRRCDGFFQECFSAHETFPAVRTWLTAASKDDTVPKHLKVWCQNAAKSSKNYLQEFAHVCAARWLADSSDDFRLESFLIFFYYARTQLVSYIPLSSIRMS